MKPTRTYRGEGKMRLMGLETFGLTPTSFRRLTKRNVQAFVYLRTYDLTPAVRKLIPTKRFPYMSARVARWIRGLRSFFPRLSFKESVGRVPGSSASGWSQLPSTLEVQGTARQVNSLSKLPGVSSVYISSIAGYRRRPTSKATLTWYCVRALVVIRVERTRFGNQNTEDRFVLVRASSFDDAKKRLAKSWREYATPYLNSDGRMVSWTLDKIIDVFDTAEAEIDPKGTEVYSKLLRRRMRPKYVWRP